ncbi:pilus assembly protein [Microbulbifer hainanensis]|uniref:pilus assembly protein n=1 Tax=Microbulbifer hainanensis TaxID=2735675 RepID=UPI0018683842|nr:PilC/PilY family type IV pilus protein [Microbulbifer hainanensis]
MKGIIPRGRFQQATLSASLGFSVTLSICAAADPLTLSDAPLQSLGKTEPNLMLVLDSSEAMATNTLSDGQTQLQAAKQAAVNVVNSVNNVRVGVARLNRTNITNVGGDGGASDDDGALVLKNLTSLSESGARQDIISIINAIDGSGFAPLSEALASMGRYFTIGFDPSGQLVAHPDGIASSGTSAEIFGPEPSYAAGLSSPTGNNLPVQEYCQKSTLVMLTEGVPTKDRDLSANTFLEDYDGDCTDVETPCLTFDRKPNEIYSSDGGSDYLDDVAGALYDIDLRPDLTDPDDPDQKNNVISYFIGFGDNQLLADAGINGFGGFTIVSDTAAMENALSETINSISSFVGTQSSVSFNTTTLESGSVIYSAKFDTDDFSGRLFARYLDPNTGRIDGTQWEASELLAGRTSVGRQILTYVDGQGVPFTRSSPMANLGTPQRLDLQVDASDGSTDDPDGLWDNRLEYIRGDTSSDRLDGFRTRGRFTAGISVGRVKLLGDIVHSSPVYVGAPDLSWPSTFGTPDATYDQFTLDFQNRAPVVYIGANDGMLHGFLADSGDELFAYVPKLVASTDRANGLHYFTSSVYTHKYYVDLTPAVSDVFVDPQGGGSPEWITLLVGGLRGGGKGYFALDVTDPASLTEANADNVVLWEFDGGDDTDRANLGFSYSEAKIAKLNNGEWAVIFGNGYNSDNGVAGLFIVYIEAGADGTWQSDDWLFISTDAGTVDDRKNGLSTPRLVDLDGDSIVDRAYAGDLMGNMWAFDLSGNRDSQWDVVGGHPLFKAPGETIMAAPLIAENTAVTDGASPNVLVLFGTGQYLNKGDLVDQNAGAFYAVWDNGDTVSGASLTEGDLAERLVETVGSGRKSDPDDPEMDWAQQHGWYIRLDRGTGNFAGERVVTSPALRGNTLFFNTIIPNPDSCSSSGTGYLMSLDFTSGLSGTEAVADFNNDGEIDEGDVGFIGKLFEPCIGAHCKEGDGDDGVVSGDPGMPGQPGFVGDVRCTPGSNGGVVCDDIRVSVANRSGRIAWEQVQPR